MIWHLWKKWWIIKYVQLNRVSKLYFWKQPDFPNVLEDILQSHEGKLKPWLFFFYYTFLTAMPIKHYFEFLCFASQLQLPNKTYCPDSVNSNQCSTPWWTKEVMTADIKSFLTVSTFLSFSSSVGNIPPERVGSFYNKLHVSCLHFSPPKILLYRWSTSKRLIIYFPAA